MPDEDIIVRAIDSAADFVESDAEEVGLETEAYFQRLHTELKARAENIGSSFNLAAEV